MFETIILTLGPAPGLLGDVAAMHGRYYAREWGFPTCFEAMVAREMGDFLLRYEPARDRICSVAEHGRILGSITIDGSDPGAAEGQGHLRWFILDESLAGQGLGGRMLGEAVEFARNAGLSSLYLTTFRGLEPAGTLYARAGFHVVSECTGETWGRAVMEQRLEMAL
ncbi:MAG: GNAT family N-acetyltransferase [Alphaproteobacteria bacterium]